MNIRLSELIDRTLKGDYAGCVKYKGMLYYPDPENKTYVNIYGVTLWGVLISHVEDGMPLSEVKLEVYSR